MPKQRKTDQQLIEELATQIVAGWATGLTKEERDSLNEESGRDDVVMDLAGETAGRMEDALLEALNKRFPPK
jgi:hypothetical protein